MPNRQPLGTMLMANHRTLTSRIYARAKRAAFLGTKTVVQTLAASLARKSDKRAVFIAGHQRSGTNMLMDVLERSYETDVYHERDPRAFDHYRMRELPVILDLYDRSKARRFVIKALCELQDLPELMQAFPGARAIWLVRNYDDVVNSAVRSFPDFAKYAQLLADAPEMTGWRGQGMSPETRAIVRSVIHPDITETSAAALQWYVRNILFFERGLDQNPEVLLLQYEDLVTNPELELSRLFEFIGIRYDPALSKPVFATSIGKTRAPAIDPPIRELCDALTQRFREAMNPHKAKSDCMSESPEARACQTPV